jgi:hypothetical protein
LAIASNNRRSFESKCERGRNPAFAGERFGNLRTLRSM